MTTANKIEFFALLFLGIISSVAILIPTQVVSLIINKLSGLPVVIFGLKIPDSINSVTIWNNITTANKEVKLKDKFIKIRIRYSGEDLAIISAIRTLYSISFA